MPPQYEGQLDVMSRDVIRDSIEEAQGIIAQFEQAKSEQEQ